MKTEDFEVLRSIAGILSPAVSDPRPDMYPIPVGRINPEDWEAPRDYGFFVPKQIGVKCPRCLKEVFLGCRVVKPALSEIRSGVMTGHCPRSQCGFQGVTFFLVGLVSANARNTRNFSPRCKEIWMTPEPDQRVPIEANLTGRLKIAYEASIRAYNAGDAVQSVSSCGRFLEAICKQNFPKTNGKETIKPLFNKLRKNLKANPDYKALLSPLLEVDEAFKLSRDVSAHFDLEKEPDMDLASKILDLTDFLIRYIYVIADEAKEVEDYLQNLGPNDLPAEDPDS